MAINAYTGGKGERNPGKLVLLAGIFKKVTAVISNTHTVTT